MRRKKNRQPARGSVMEKNRLTTRRLHQFSHGARSHPAGEHQRESFQVSASFANYLFLFWGGVRDREVSIIRVNSAVGCSKKKQKKNVMDKNG